MKIAILSFENSEEHILNDILSQIKNRTNYQIRSTVLESEILQRGELTINPICRTLEKNGEKIHLTVYEFDTLYLLAKKPGWVFSKAQIYNQIWKEPYYQAYHRVIHVIQNLREKIESDRKHPTYILTINCYGYKFNESYQLSD